VAETVPGFEMGVWTALFVPAGTPRPLIERLDLATREALSQLRGRFTELGLEPFPAGPDELATYLRAEIAKWTGVVRAARITID
jgi:tripartite-type tricarboxylate transporter receptor subunit TctC